MRFSSLVVLFSAAIFGSFFLPWLRSPLGDTPTPYEMFQRVPFDNLTDLPLMLLVFFGSFALAGFCGIIALFGLGSRLLALLGGALPLGLAGYAVLSASQQLRDAGFPVPDIEDWNTFQTFAEEFFRIGLFAYLGGAVLLLIIAVIDPGRPLTRRR